MADLFTPAYTFVVASGTIIVDTQLINQQVIDGYKLTFGDDLVITPDNPQGVLITAETLGRVSVADNNATIGNQINPNLSGGVYLDAIMQLTGIQRTPQTFSIVVGKVAGVVGTIIPIGSLATDTNGIQWATMVAVTIPTGGNTTVNFQATVSGSITVAVHGLNTITSTVLGWETVDNLAVQAVLGSSTQSDAAARLYRRDTLAVQGQAVDVAILSGLYATLGVTSATFRENDQDTTETIDGVVMVPHSIYACVAGGTDLDVATTLSVKKGGGTNYNNGMSMTPVSVPVTMAFSGQVINVLFDRPDPIAINVIVAISAGSAVQDPITATKQAVVDYGAGVLGNGEPGLRVGTSVSAFEIAGAVNYENPGIFVRSVFIAIAPTTPTASTTIDMALWQQASIQLSNVSVNVI